jgi:hypothetical protein
MADLYTTAQAYGNDGNPIAASYLGANGRQLNLDKGQTFSATNPLTDLGTPQLQIVKFSIADVNMSTTPTIANSNLSQLIRVVQTVGEVYSVGAFTNANPSVGVMLVKKDTMNDFDSDNTTQGYGKLETAINNAVSGATATVTAGSLTGVTIS